MGLTIVCNESNGSLINDLVLCRAASEAWLGPTVDAPVELDAFARVALFLDRLEHMCLREKIQAW